MGAVSTPIKLSSAPAEKQYFFIILVSHYPWPRIETNQSKINCGYSSLIATGR
jgi:hypothetical protein